MHSKRVLAILICLSLTFSVLTSITSYADEQINKEYYAKAGETLKALGIIDNYFTDNMMLGEQYTRSEFISIICKIIMPESSDEKLNMDFNYWGIQGKSELAKALTVNDVIRILVDITGYSFKTESYNDKDEGYYSTAANIGILKNVSLNKETFSKGDVITMLYNAVKIDMAIKSVYEYKIYKGKTLLSEYLDIYTVNGYVTENSVTSLNGKSTLKNAEIKIQDNNGKISVYTDESNIGQDYFGYSVTAYYKKAESSDENVLLYITKGSKNDVLYVAGKDVMGIDIELSTRTLKYQVEDGNTVKDESVELPVDICVIYNGMYVEYRRTVLEMLNEMPEPYNLEDVTLVDYDNDGTFDIMFVDVYRNIVAAIINKTEQFVSDYYGTEAADLKADSSSFITLKKSDGTITDFDYIGINDVLSVKEAQFGGIRKAEVTICRKVYAGILVNRELDDNNCILTIAPYNYNNYKQADDDNYTKSTYMLAGNMLSRSENISFDNLYTFFMDYRGYIAGYTNKNFIADKVIADTYLAENHVAYIDKFQRKTGVSKRFLFKMYAQNAAQTSFELKIFTTAEKFRINGEAITSDKDETYVLGKIDNKFVTYKLNEDGELISIKTANNAIVEGELSSLNGTYGISNLYYKTNGGVFSPATNVNGPTIQKKSTTMFICVPGDDVEDTINTDDIYYFTKYPTLLNDKVYTVEGFVFSEKSVAANFIIIKKNTINEIDQTYMFLVDTVNSAINPDGEKVLKLTGFQNKAAVTYYTTGEWLVNSKTEDKIDVHSGDILEISTTSKKEINYALRVYDYVKDDYDAVAASDYRSPNRIAIGTVYKVDDQYFSMIPKGYDFKNDNAESYNSTSYRLTVYDAATPRDPQLRKGFISEFVPYVINTEKATRIVISSNSGEPREAFLFIR